MVHNQDRDVSALREVLKRCRRGSGAGGFGRCRAARVAGPPCRPTRSLSIVGRAAVLNRLSCCAFTDEPVKEADPMMILEAARWAPSSCNSPPLTLHLCATGDAGLGQARGSADPEQLVVGHQGVGDGRTCVHLNDAADAAPGEENDLSAYKRSELRVDRPRSAQTSRSSARRPSSLGRSAMR